VTSLPADDQYAVSCLHSRTGVDAKSSIKGIAVQVRRRVSQLLVIQGGRQPNAFSQDQSRGKASGGDVVGHLAELPLKTIQKPVRCGPQSVGEGYSGFPLAWPENSVRCLPKFSKKSTNARSNRRNLTHGIGPTMAYSHEAQLVLKAPCEHNNLRLDAGEHAKGDVVVVPDVDGDEMHRMVSYAKGGFQNPTGDVPSECSSA